MCTLSDAYKIMIMATSKNFQTIHKRYQEEGLPHGVSIIRFSQQNGIVYKQYERWLKNRGNVSIHSVSLTNVPAEEVQDDILETSKKETDEFVSLSFIFEKSCFIPLDFARIYIDFRR